MNEDQKKGSFLALTCVTILTGLFIAFGLSTIVAGAAAVGICFVGTMVAR